MGFLLEFPQEFYEATEDSFLIGLIQIKFEEYQVNFLGILIYEQNQVLELLRFYQQYRLVMMLCFEGLLEYF